MRSNILSISPGDHNAPEEERKFHDLIDELSQNRLVAREMLSRVKKVSQKIEVIFPQTVDYKSKFVLETKMKAIGDVMATELAIVKQIDDSVKTEFELRRKISGSEEDGSEVSLMQLADALDILDQRTKKKELNIGEKDERRTQSG